MARQETDQAQLTLTGERLRSLRALHERHLGGSMGTLADSAAALSREESVRAQARSGESGPNPTLRSAADAVGARSGVICRADGVVLDGAEIHGPQATGVLAEGLRAVLDRPSGAAHFTDFRAYAPRANAPHAFFLAPIFSEAPSPGQVAEGAAPIGVLGLEIDAARISRLLTGDGAWLGEGLGQTGEVYLVGADRLMRTESRFLAEDRDGYAQALVQAQTPENMIQRILDDSTSILLQAVDTRAVSAALDGVRNTEVITDYRGEPVLSSYAPLAIGEQRFALVAEMDMSEIRRAGNRVARQILIPALALLLGVGVLALVLGNQRTRRLRRMRTSAFSVATACGLTTQAPEVVDDEVAACEVAVDALDESVTKTMRRSKFLRAVFDADPAPVFVVAYPKAATREGRDDPQLLEVSREGMRVTGLEPEEVPRMRLSDVIVPQVDGAPSVDAKSEASEEHWLDSLCATGHVERVPVKLRLQDQVPKEALLQGTVHSEGPEEDWFVVLALTEPVDGGGSS